MPLVPKNFFRRKFTILGVQKFFGHTKIFREILIFKISQNNTISHKIDRICPIFLYYKLILPDCEANIVRLALFAQQTWGGGGGANPCIKDHFNGIREIFRTNRETWRSARKPGDSRVNRETWQL